ncbi:hypothetical protein AMAG_09366 [Allomyces macrogynus ATCC 38327]|uniref:Vacuolar fusion protein MON1 n=1 Tax=Allomyces macrogynus (strain ATCC 38327) TaxID=578462 RepID=A0A0L0SPL1_ALLM3|nr:hypothetical protein AMAG_09366 [Allomyces macrogynus ATCC 38327]|eukprot:KNE64339.1 hypothetical protein AMAG_09366 [Allomyces macrogynus ATCC 38327]
MSVQVASGLSSSSSSAQALDPQSAAWRQQSKHFFVLADSGKPVYVRHGDETSMTGLLSLLQVLVAQCQRHHDDVLRSVQLPPPAGHLLVFLVRRPLILVAAARTRESEPQLRAQLAALHSFLLSQLTQAQLAALFARHPNLDLRPLLGAAAAAQLTHLCDAFGTDVRFLMACVESVPVARAVRKRFGSALLRGSEGRPNLLYGMLLHGAGQLISLIRPKSHSLHPSDLFNVFTLVTTHPQFRSSEHWIPVCLPKFNDQGFLFAYISYITPEMGLVLMSSDKEAFFEMQATREAVIDYMLKNGLVLESKALDQPMYAADLVHEPTCKHFIYKSKAHVQYVQSAVPTGMALSKLTAKYAKLHAALHDRDAPMKLLWLEGDEDGESTLCWNSAAFELYCTWDAAVPRVTAIRNANTIAKWAKANGEDLFILDSPTFS